MGQELRRWPQLRYPETWSQSVPGEGQLSQIACVREPVLSQAALGLQVSGL